MELGFTVCNLAKLANSFCRRKRCSLASESQLWHSCLFLHSAELCLQLTLFLTSVNYGLLVPEICKHAPNSVLWIRLSRGTREETVTCSREGGGKVGQLEIFYPDPHYLPVHLLFTFRYTHITTGIEVSQCQQQTRPAETEWRTCTPSLLQQAGHAHTVRCSVSAQGWKVLTMP